MSWALRPLVDQGDSHSVSQMARITVAYELLIDEERRRVYNNTGEVDGLRPFKPKRLGKDLLKQDIRARLLTETKPLEDSALVLLFSENLLDLMEGVDTDLPVKGHEPNLNKAILRILEESPESAFRTTHEDFLAAKASFAYRFVVSSVRREDFHNRFILTSKLLAYMTLPETPNVGANIKRLIECMSGFNRGVLDRRPIHQIEKTFFLEWYAYAFLYLSSGELNDIFWGGGRNYSTKLDIEGRNDILDGVAKILIHMPTIPMGMDHHSQQAEITLVKMLTQYPNPDALKTLEYIYKWSRHKLVRGAAKDGVLYIMNWGGPLDDVLRSQGVRILEAPTPWHDRPDCDGILNGTSTQALTVLSQ